MRFVQGVLEHENPQKRRILVAEQREQISQYPQQIKPVKKQNTEIPTGRYFSAEQNGKPKRFINAKNRTAY